MIEYVRDHWVTRNKSGFINRWLRRVARWVLYGVSPIPPKKVPPLTYAQREAARMARFEHWTDEFVHHAGQYMPDQPDWWRENGNS